MRQRLTAVFTIAVLLACIGCATAPQQSSALQSLLTGEKTFDLLMTLVGSSYQAGVWGPPGSPQAENVRRTASQVSVAVGAASKAAIAAIEQKRDPSAYLTDIAAAIAQLTAILPQSKRSELLSPPPPTPRLAFNTPDSYFGSAR